MLVMVVVVAIDFGMFLIRNRKTSNLIKYIFAGMHFWLSHLESVLLFLFNTEML